MPSKELDRTERLNWTELRCTQAFLYSMYVIYGMCCSESLSCVWCWESMDCSPPGSSFHGDFPGKITPVSYHTLLQGIFPTQGSNPGLSHCSQILYHLSHHRSSNIWNITVLFVCVELLLIILMVSLNLHIYFKIIYGIQRILDFATSEMG